MKTLTTLIEALVIWLKTNKTDYENKQVQCPYQLIESINF